jgi:nitroimidazol reductase NimA-like FMN-containing flavoprotein (pyridoxamine 5'-phosphate oxidase superfamily)
MSERQFIPARAEMEQILQEESIGYLGMAVNGTPYVVPLNYAYVEGKILFHCALTGKKLEYIEKNPRVCFSVGRQYGPVRPHGDGDPCHVDSDSVICYGLARIVTEPVERKRVLDSFNHSFDPDADGISVEDAANCCAVEIRIQEMTGRRERERQRTFWRWRFDDD